jgi:hypothetical protein
MWSPYSGAPTRYRGWRGKAEESLAELDKLSKRHHVAPFLRAVIHTGVGRKKRAFEWLEKAYDERDWHMWLLKIAPVFDGLRSDPRFTKLLTRMGLG